MAMRNLNSKYDPEAEAEVIPWVQQLTGCEVPRGCELVGKELRKGVILMRLIMKIYADTPNLPPAAEKLKPRLKENAPGKDFKELENVNNFLTAAQAYGVPQNCLFVAIDLREIRSMGMVMNTLIRLGTECQRNGFNGPVIGPRPTYENKRQFTAEQLNASKTIIGLQAGSNKGASQSGMSMGASRHISDIKVEEMSAEAKGVIGLQAGSNKGASQRGMAIGATRHIADMKIAEMSDSGKSTIGLQSGSNKGASQTGMSMGGIRHISDMKVGDMSAEGKSVIGLQSGSNKGATQSGMSMGGIRHISDMKVGDMSAEGKGVIGLQAGSNLGASQAGMAMGTQRHINDLRVGELE